MRPPKSSTRIHTFCCVSACALIVAGCQREPSAPPSHAHTPATSPLTTPQMTIPQQAESAAAPEPRAATSAAPAASTTRKQRAAPSDNQPVPTPLVDLLLNPRDRQVLTAPPHDSSPSDSSVSPDGAANSQSTQRELDVPSAALLAEHNIRTLVGKHVTIYTDLPESLAVNELPTVFEQAVPQWANYFRIPEVSVRNWHVSACLMRSVEPFRAVGLLPADVPEFPFGYQHGAMFWVLEQPSDYYLRHLFLHEGTHAFMNNLMGGAGPPWYMEGVAELLATHRWNDRQLTLNYMPQTRDEVPYWGRIKIVQDEFAAGRALMLEEVMQLDHAAFREVRAYAWTWAAAAFLDGHPSYQARFRALRHHVQDAPARFNTRFQQELMHHLRQVDEEWQLFILHADYGYDFARAAVQYKSGVPLPSAGAVVTIDASRGWQSTGYRLEAGKAYLVEAAGRYELGHDPRPWASEPDGVTLHYYQGQPLGRLMGNVRLDQARPGIANLGRPVSIGRQRVVRPRDAGTLYLWINESPAALADNRGTIEVRLVPIPASDDGDRGAALKSAAAPN